MDGLILGIDLGKFNSTCCWYDPATKAATFRSAQTNDLGREPPCHPACTRPHGRARQRRAATAKMGSALPPAATTDTNLSPAATTQNPVRPAHHRHDGSPRKRNLPPSKDSTLDNLGYR